MSKENEFGQKLTDAGISINGIVGAGPTCGIVFDSAATPAQRAAAVALRNAFDWTETPGPTVPAVLAVIAAMTVARRQVLYAAVVAELIVRFGLRVDLT